MTKATPQCYCFKFKDRADKEIEYWARCSMNKGLSLIKLPLLNTSNPKLEMAALQWFANGDSDKAVPSELQGVILMGERAEEVFGENAFWTDVLSRLEYSPMTYYRPEDLDRLRINAKNLELIKKIGHSFFYLNEEQQVQVAAEVLQIFSDDPDSLDDGIVREIIKQVFLAVRYGKPVIREKYIELVKKYLVPEFTGGKRVSKPIFRGEVIHLLEILAKNLSDKCKQTLRWAGLWQSKKEVREELEAEFRRQRKHRAITDKMVEAARMEKWREYSHDHLLHHPPDERIVWLASERPFDYRDSYKLVINPRIFAKEYYGLKAGIGYETDRRKPKNKMVN